MKELVQDHTTVNRRSLHTRGAWIEREYMDKIRGSKESRSTHVERGLKARREIYRDTKNRRSTHVERGLKAVDLAGTQYEKGSLHTRGAWIERKWFTAVVTPDKSLHTRGAWIERYWNDNPRNSKRSLHTRGAWIERSLIPT